MPQGRHLVQDARVPLEPAEGLLGRLSVHALQPELQPADVVRIARAGVRVPLGVHPVHGPIFDWLERDHLHGRLVERAASVICKGVDLWVVDNGPPERRGSDAVALGHRLLDGGDDPPLRRDDHVPPVVAMLAAGGLALVSQRR
eukprot:1575607-Pyramimonas_sp.AAC.1